MQVAQANRYILGVALTDAQIAELKTDIVWLLKQNVTLADGGTQEVLVPQVYLHASNVEVTGQGTLIAGNDVAFQTAQDIVNSGTNINQVASVSGKDITMAAGRDVSLGTVNENFRQQINRANDGGASNWIGTLIGPNLVDRSNGVHRISESGVNRATLTGSKDVSTPKSVATTSACAPVRTW